MSDNFKPEYGTGIRFNDPVINQKWPIKPKVISKKDLNFLDYKKIK